MKLLIVGANGGIGTALLRQAEVMTEIDKVYTLSSKRVTAGAESLHASVLEEPELVGDWISSLKVDAIISCSGVLHSQTLKPEKRLSELSESNFSENLALNCTAHLLLLQQVERVVSVRTNLKVLLLSAMVGSITDNRIGGWYSYRMSKAALNMGIKNIAIEWSRTRPNWTVAAVHPGTTKTALSAPFTKRIGDEKLYTAEKTADRLFKILAELTTEESGRLLHWGGSVLPY